MVITTNMFFNFINTHLDFVRQRSCSDFYCCSIKSQTHKTTRTFTGSTKQVGSDFTSPPDCIKTHSGAVRLASTMQSLADCYICCFYSIYLFIHFLQFLVCVCSQNEQINKSINQSRYVSGRWKDTERNKCRKMEAEEMGTEMEDWSQQA